MTSERESRTERGHDEILRMARTNRLKALRFVSDDIEWYVAYRGKYGWSACRGSGEWMDAPPDEDVEHSMRVYDSVELVDLSETPEEVTL